MQISTVKNLFVPNKIALMHIDVVSVTLRMHSSSIMHSSKENVSPNNNELYSLSSVPYNQ